VSILETVKASIIFPSHVEEARRDAFTSQINTELSVLTLQAACLLIKALPDVEDVMVKFRVDEIQSVLAGEMFPDSEIIAIAQR
jgi:hypothetical protein